MRLSRTKLLLPVVLLSAFLAVGCGDDDKDETKGESSLKGHIKTNEDEKSGSSAYVPPDPKNDKQLIFAVEYLKSGGKLEAPKKAEAPVAAEETKKN